MVREWRRESKGREGEGEGGGGRGSWGFLNLKGWVVWVFFGGSLWVGEGRAGRLGKRVPSIGGGM